MEVNVAGERGGLVCSVLAPNSISLLNVSKHYLRFSIDTCWKHFSASDGRDVESSSSH